MKRERERPGSSFRVGLLAVDTVAGSVVSATVRDMKALWGAAGRLRLVSVTAADNSAAVERVIRRWCDREGFDVICTVGGSGHLACDFVPDLTGRLLTKTLPGIEERMYLSRPRCPDDLLFRGRAGIRRRTLLINLPARAARIRAILAFLVPVLPHAIEKIGGSNRECGRREGSE